MAKSGIDGHAHAIGQRLFRPLPRICRMIGALDLKFLKIARIATT
jgi:hypothetical protein